MRRVLAPLAAGLMTASMLVTLPSGQAAADPTSGSSSSSAASAPDPSSTSATPDSTASSSASDSSSPSDTPSPSSSSSQSSAPTSTPPAPTSSPAPTSTTSATSTTKSTTTKNTTTTVRSDVAPNATADAGCNAGWPVAVVAGFEIDGNLCVNSNGNDDWSSVGGQPVENDTFADSTGFTGGASESGTNGWPWTAAQTAGSISPNDKTDIGNVYVRTTTVGTDVYTFFGFERATNKGSVAYYVELNKLPNSSGPVPNRSVGDLRLTINQTGSNTISLVGADTWSGSAWTSLGSLAGFTGQVNQAGPTGTNVTTNFSGAPLAAGTFAEFAVDLSTLFGSADCSGNYGVINVRSAASPSDTSSLSDWINPISLAVPSTCASVKVAKNWVVDGTSYANGNQPFGSASLALTGQSSPAFGTEYATQNTGAKSGKHYVIGDSVTIGESVSGLPAGCTNVASGDTGTKTLGAGLNSYAITNTVTCTYLTLAKVVQGGSAQPGDWTLNASGPSTVSGASGTVATTKVHVAAGAYTLSETGGPSGYTLTSLVCSPNAASGTSLTIAAGDNVTCTFTNTAVASVKITKTWVIDGTSYADGSQPTAYSSAPTLTGGSGTAPATFGATGTGYRYGDSVTVGETTPQVPTGCVNVASGDLGSHALAGGLNTFAITNTVTCTYLTLVKDVNGTASPSDWTLTAGGPTPVSGTANSATVTKVHVAPGTYTLSENGPTGYQQTGLVCSPVSATGNTVVLAGGDNVTCTFTNTAVGKLTLQKAWVHGAAGDKTTLSVTGGTDVVSTALGGTQTDTIHTVVVNVLEGRSIDLAEALDSNNAGAYTSSISCDQSGLSPNPTGTGGTYTMPLAADDVTCTITNTRTSTTLVLNKVWQNGHPGDTATLTADAVTAAAPSTVVTGAASESDTTASHEVSVTVYSGDTVGLSEALGGANTGTYTSTSSCSAGSLSTTAGTSSTLTVPKDLSAVGTIGCSFTNDRTSATLVLRKEWMNGAGGDTAGLSMSGSNPAISGTATSTADGSADQLDTANTVSRTVYSGQPITLGEGLPGTNTGTYTSSLSCTDATGLTYTAGARSGTYTLPGNVAGPVTCTYVNTRTSATLTLQKSWQVGAAGDSATLSIDGGHQVTATVPVGGSGASSQTTSVTVFSGQALTLAEAPGTNTGTYDARLSCASGGLSYTDGALTGTYTVPGAPADVTCTFTNARRTATITLQKAWVDGAQGDQAQLSISGSDALTTGSNTSTATGAAGTETDSSHAATALIFSGETVNLAELLPPNGHANTGSYTSSISCTPNSGFAAGAGGQGGTLTVPATPADVTCTVVNTRTSATLTLQKSWTNGASGDTATLSINGDTSGVGHAVATVPGGGSGVSTDKATTTIRSGANITLAEVLGGGNIGDYTAQVSCDQPGLTANGSGTGGTFAVPAAPVNVVCTIVNTRTSAQLVLQKTWVNAASGDSTTLTVSGTDAATGATAVSTSSGQAGSWTDTRNQATTTVFSGETVTVREALGTTVGTYGYALACDNGITVGQNSGTSGVFVVPAALSGTTVTCTVTNTRTRAQLTLRKAWVNGYAGDTAGLTISGSGQSGSGTNTSTATGAAGTQTDTGHAVTVTVYSGDTVTLGELLGGGNHGSYSPAIACDPTAGFTAAGTQDGGSYLVPAAPANATCTVTNTRTTSTLTLQKAWLNGYQNDSTTLTISGSGLSGSGSNTSSAAGTAGTQTDSGDTVTVTVYSGDTLTLGEALAGTNHGSYTASVACDPTAGFTANIPGNGGTYVVPGAPSATLCTVTNARIAETLVLEKHWVGAVAANTAALTVSGSGLSDSGATTATVPSNGFTGTSTETVHATIYSGDAISLSEALGGPNPAYTSTLTCSSGSLNAAQDGTSGTLIAPASGGTVTCAFANTADAAMWTLSKSSLPASGSVVAPGSQITYTLTATHTSGVSATDVTVTDDLSQVLDHASIGTITPSIGTAQLNGTTLEWTIPQLDTSATVTYVVTVDPSASDVELTNVATPGTGGTCSGSCTTHHEVPQITKTFVAATQHLVAGVWDGTWDVTYTVSVANPSATLPVTYTLTDTPAFPADVTVNGATVSSAATNGGTVIGGLDNTWSAPTLEIVTDRSIPADTTDVYTIVANATVPVDEAASTCTGAPQHGFDNASTAVFGSNSFSASACGDIPTLPIPTVAKTVTGVPVQNADGSWTITYDLAVTNPSATLASVYDLSDALDYGAGVIVDAASVTGPGGATVNPGWNGTSDTSVVTGRFIAADTVEHYTVTVTANVPATSTTTARDCTLDTGETGTGFLNGATISTGSSSSTSTACAGPVSPTITKKVVSVVPGTPGNWVVSYDVTVADPSSTTGLVYTLIDALGYPSQITITSATVSGKDSGGTSIPTEAAWNGQSAAVVVSGRALAAGGLDTFRVVVGTTVPPAVTSDLNCSSAGAGHGYFNQAVARSGDDSFSAEACANITASQALPTQIVPPPTSPPTSQPPLSSTGAGPLGAEIGWGIGLLGLGLLLALAGSRRRYRRAH